MISNSQTVPFKYVPVYIFQDFKSKFLVILIKKLFIIVTISFLFVLIRIFSNNIIFSEFELPFPK